MSSKRLHSFPGITGVFSYLSRLVHSGKRPGRLGAGVRGLMVGLALLLGAALPAAPAFASHSSTFAATKLSPNSQSCTVGVPCSVNIVFDIGSTPAYGISAKVSFDRTRLQVVSVSGTSSPFPIVSQNTFDNTSGTIEFMSGTIALPGPVQSSGVGGTFTVATVVFNPIAAGTSPIKFLSVNEYMINYGPYGVNGLAVDGSITVTAPVVVYTSNSQVQTWDPIFPASAYGNWPAQACAPTPAVGPNANWVNPHNAFDFGPSAHPWQPTAGFIANWINAWSNLSSQGPSGQSWTKYQTQVSGNGSFVLNLLADNCSWVYLDSTLVGYQNANLQPRTYPVTLSGTSTLTFIIFDGGGLAGGMYRLETNTGTVTFPVVAADNASITTNKGTPATNTGTYSWANGGANVPVTASVGTVTKTGTNNGTWSWSNPSTNPPYDYDVTITAGGGPAAFVQFHVHVVTDTTAPTIVGAASPAANANGWNNTNVTVSFTCADEAGGSGIASCGPTPVAVSSEGTTTVTGTATDNAGNTSTTSVTVKIDKTAPTVSLSGPAIVIQGQSASATVTASDALSGLASGTPTSVALGTSTLGANTAAVTVADNAGNSSSASFTYTVWSLACPGAPVEKEGKGTGQFNAGSTIPVKCKISDGTNLITTATGSVSIGPVSAALRWDREDKQYIATVKTDKTMVATYDVNVTLDGVGTVTVAQVNIKDHQDKDDHEDKGDNKGKGDNKDKGDNKGKGND